MLLKLEEGVVNESCFCGMLDGGGAGDDEVRCLVGDRPDID